eukprot:5146472-Amphidinium_carterae.1
MDSVAPRRTLCGPSTSSIRVTRTIEVAPDLHLVQFAAHGLLAGKQKGASRVQGQVQGDGCRDTRGSPQSHVAHGSPGFGTCMCEVLRA